MLKKLISISKETPLLFDIEAITNNLSRLKSNLIKIKDEDIPRPQSCSPHEGEKRIESLRNKELRDKEVSINMLKIKLASVKELALHYFEKHRLATFLDILDDNDFKLEKLKTSLEKKGLDTDKKLESMKIETIESYNKSIPAIITELEADLEDASAGSTSEEEQTFFGMDD